MKSVSSHILRTLRRQKPINVRNALVHNDGTEPLSSRTPGIFNWYTCGPTVYDDAHLGHARAYVSLDIIRRIISNLTGTHIDYAMGVTDIDDKILNRSKEQNTSPQVLAARYEHRFFQDMDFLNVLPPTKILRVSEYIPELQSFISDLLDSNTAYSSNRGNVYFSIQSSGSRYGQLDPSRSLTKTADVHEESSVDVELTAEKRDVRDFALWKRSSESESKEGTWDSPWGRGRPGWHVECSAMAMSALGKYLDMHTGGIDLRFPHHTNELATAEAKLYSSDKSTPGKCSCERWTHTWLHVGHLHISGHKMSKSLKNFISVREFKESGGNADEFRIFCLLHKYSSGIEYSEDRVKDGKAFLGKVCRFLERKCKVSELMSEGLNGGKRLEMKKTCSQAEKLRNEVKTVQDEIEDALLDDFDTVKALSKISKLITLANGSLNRDGEWVSGPAAIAFNSACEVVEDTMQMFGISKQSLMSEWGNNISLGDIGSEDEMIEAFVKLRSKIRTSARKKDIETIFQICDEARDDAWNNLGIRITDRKDGSSRWTKCMK